MYLWEMYTFALAFFIVVCLLILPVEVRMNFEHIDGDDQGEIHVRYLFGLIHFRRSLSQIKVKSSEEGPALEVKAPEESKSGETQKTITTKDAWGFLLHLGEWKRIAQEIYPIARKFLVRIRVKNVEIEGTVGVGNVIETGMLVGFCWSVLGTFFGYATSHCRFDSHPRIQVTPDFNQRRMKVRFAGIFQVKAGYAIVAGIRVLRVLKRRM